MSEPSKIVHAARLGALYRHQVIYSKLYEVYSYWLVVEIASESIIIRSLLSSKVVCIRNWSVDYSLTLVE